MKNAQQVQTKQITNISVSNLFGVFNHTVKLNNEDHITIVHGPNGFGKTAILKLIDALFNHRFNVLGRTPFDALYIDFNDGSQLAVAQSYQKELFEEDNIPPAPNLIFTWIGGIDKQKETFLLEAYETSELSPSKIRDLRRIEFEVPELERVGPRLWQDMTTNEILNLREVTKRYEVVANFFPLYYINKSDIVTWLKKYTATFSVSFVQVQRLIKLDIEYPIHSKADRSEVSYAVRTYSRELAQIIQNTLAKSAAQSQSLDRTFPRRLVEYIQNNVISKEELRTRLDTIETQRSRLMEVGLLDQEDDVAFQVTPTLDEHTQRVLSVYVDDMEKKLGIFEDLARKIELLRDILNSRFQYKSVSVSKEKGLIFRTNDGKDLSPIDLSSGEQHQVVLLYELLFNTDPNALVLIDEPEISLHVAWQIEFLNELQAIIELVPFDALIATHSPQIINDRWDLTVKLEGPLNNAG